MTASNIDTEIKNLLMEDEEILVSASQNRIVPGGSISTPNAIYITNRRIIYRDPKWLGMKADIVDVNYQDISNTRLNRGVFSTEIYLKARYHSDEVKLPAVSKGIAAQIHTLIQKGIRGELPRQKVADNTNTTKTNVKASLQKDSLVPAIEKLEKIMDWKQKGLITDEEFQKLKSQLLETMANGIQQEEQEPSQTLTEEKDEEQEQVQQSFDTYEDSRVGIKIMYPSDWEVHKKDESIPIILMKNGAR